MCGRGLHYYQLNRRDRRSVFHTHFIDKGGSLYKINMYRHYVGIEEVNWFGQVARPCIDKINEPIKSPQTCMYIIGGGFWPPGKLYFQFDFLYRNIRSLTRKPIFFSFASGGAIIWRMASKTILNWASYFFSISSIFCFSSLCVASISLSFVKVLII